MDGSTHLGDPDVQLLDELAGLGLALCRDLSARALQAEDADAAAKLATAFHKVSRGVRQSLALKQKLARDRAAFAAELGPQIARQRREAAEHRRDQLKRRLCQVLWDEHEYENDAHYYELTGAVHDELKAAALLDGFADEPFETHLARLKAHFDPANWTFSDPGEDDDEDDSPWRPKADSS